MGLKLRFISGILFGTGGVAIKAILNILLIPIILLHLGAENYGFYTILISLSDILVMFDLGLTTGIIHRLSRTIAEDNRTQINETLSVGQRLYSLFLLIMIGIGIPAVPWIQQSFHLSPALAQAAHICLYIVLADAAINFAGCFFRSVLMAHSLYQWTNAADVIQGLVSNLLSCLLLLAGYGLTEVLMVRLASTVLQNSFLIYQVYKVEPNALRLHSCFSWTAFKDMFVVSMSSMVGKVCTILGYRLDNFIIASSLGLMDVAAYSLVARIFGQVPYFTSKLSEGMLPIFLKMDTRDKLGGTQHNSGFFFLRISTFINYVTLVLLLLISLHYHTIFTALSKGHINYNNTLLMVWIIIPMLWSSALVCPAYDYLFAKRHFKFQSILSLISTTLNFILSLTLVKAIGIAGAILGSLIPHFIEHQCFIIPRTCEELDISMLSYYKTVHLKNILPLLSVFLIVEGGQMLFIHQIASNYLGLLVLTAMAVSVGSFVWLQYTASLMERSFFWEKLLPQVMGNINGLLKLPTTSKKAVDAP